MILNKPITIAFGNMGIYKSNLSCILSLHIGNAKIDAHFLLIDEIEPNLILGMDILSLLIPFTFYNNIFAFTYNSKAYSTPLKDVYNISPFGRKPVAVIKIINENWLLSSEIPTLHQTANLAISSVQNMHSCWVAQNACIINSRINLLLEDQSITETSIQPWKEFYQWNDGWNEVKHEATIFDGSIFVTIQKDSIWEKQWILGLNMINTCVDNIKAFASHNIQLSQNLTLISLQLFYGIYHVLAKTAFGYSGGHISLLHTAKLYVNSIVQMLWVSDWGNPFVASLLIFLRKCDWDKPVDQYLDRSENYAQMIGESPEKYAYT